MSHLIILCIGLICFYNDNEMIKCAECGCSVHCSVFSLIMPFVTVKSAWLSLSFEHKVASLVDSLHSQSLKDICCTLGLTVAGKSCNKLGWASSIVDRFDKRCMELIGKTPSSVKDELVAQGIDFDNSTQDFYVVYALHLQTEFSDDVFTLLIKSEKSVIDHPSPVIEDELSWLDLTPEHQKSMEICINLI
jgi:hypothetical protein